MARLFAAAIFGSAVLLFVVQPLAGKILLPVLGGSPTVWSTCLVFFQTVLLVGYLYAHAVSTWVPRPWQGLVHLGVLIAASITLPLSIEIGAPGEADPRWWTLRALAGTVGVPLFALSATAPLLQRWFSRTDDPSAGDPYFLYGTSNAGSLLGLLAYPFVEPLTARSDQAAIWSVGFWGVAVLIAACGYTGVRRSPPEAGEARAGSPAAPVTMSRRALWIALAAVPSALLIGVTQHLATDVVSAPLLWVVPLSLYLVTFIVSFSRRGFGRAQQWGRAAPAAALVVLVLALADVRYPIVAVTLIHLAAFAVLAMMCHTRLAEMRPDPSRLTEYFVFVSLGGVLGGAAVALVAPAIFSSVLEYPLAIAAVLLLRPQTADADRLSGTRVGQWAWRAAATIMLVAAYWSVSAFDARIAGDAESAQRAIRASFAIPAVLLLVSARTALLFAGTAAGLLLAAGVVRTGGDVLHRERTFFGVHQVTSMQDGAWHVLTHGTTTHGIQAVGGRTRLLPTAYYHPSGPFGDVVFTLSPDGRFRDVGVVGLGAGALAGYAGNGTRMDFFEVDEAVIRIADAPQYFTYLTDARARPGATIRTMAVDGRLGIGAAAAGTYDVIVIDAFSSDAIPTHLVTREAVALYASRLKPHGVMAFHVSNRFFDLRPALARIADDGGLVAYARADAQVPAERAAEGMRPSTWVVLARDSSDLGQIAHAAPRWQRLTAPTGARVWTDDYTNVIGALE